MMKRILSLLLCGLLVFGCLNVGFVNVSAASATTELTKLAKKFPNGKYWNHVGSKTNNPDGYTNTACTHHFSSGCSITPGGCECNSFLNAIQCMGFAYKSAYDIVGTNPREWDKQTTLNLSALCVGDIIRYSGHSITVVGVSGSTVAYVGANWGGNCLIKWGKMDKSKLTSFSYVLHDKNNTRKNSDVDIYEKISNSDGENVIEEPVSDFETWKMAADANLNIRSTSSVSAAIIGQVPASKTFPVTKKIDTGSYLWGYVTYDGVSGWAALNYSEYVSGSYASPTVKSVSASPVARRSFTLSFSAVDGADSYTVCFYDSNGKAYLTKTISAASGSFTLKDAGKYTVKVTAKNSKTPSWKMTGKAYSLTVSGQTTTTDDDAKSVEKWTMNNEGNLNIRSSASVSALVLGVVPAGKSFLVMQKTDKDGYLWGYVQYGSLKGWAALNYPKYVSGYYEKPTIKSVSSSVTEGKEFGVSFSSVSGASAYSVRIYDSDSKLVSSKTVTSNSAKLVVRDAGKYKVKVIASNSKSPSWKIAGSSYAFDVAEGTDKIEKISLTSKLKLIKGASYVLKPTITPGSAKGKLVYSSSDKNVAVVSSDGKVTAVGYGSAVITCASADNPEIKASCAVAVSTEAVKNIRQNAAKTTAASTVLTWDKVPDATAYSVYYYGSKLTKIGTVKTNTISVKGLKSNQSRKIVVYTYYSKDGKNYYSPSSAVYTITTSPAAVKNVRVTDIQESTAVLRWDKTAGADSYVIYRYVKGKGYVSTASTKNNYYQFKGKAGQTDKLRVKAVNSVGSMKLYSDFSDYTNLIFKPSATKLSAAGAKDSVTLKWNKVPGASGYEVFRYTSDGYKKIKTLSASASSLKVTGLKGKTSYTFKVRAFSKAGSTVAYAVSAKTTVKTK
ncbi:MAG: fibronectin type III domain-containing protein [Acutalibacteraceae bacterium]